MLVWGCRGWGETDNKQKGKSYSVMVSAMQRITTEQCSEAWGRGASSICMER